MTTYNTVTPLTQAAPLPGERQQPVRAPSVASDASVPLIQAAIGGLLISTSLMIAALGLAVLTGVHLLTLEAMIAIGCAWLAIATLGTTVLWWGRLDIAQRTVWFTERTMGVNLDKNPAISRPHGLAVNPEDTKPVDPGVVMQMKTADLITAVFARQSTTWSSIRADLPELDDAGVEYNQIRNELIRVGLAAWRGTGRNHGWTLRPGLTLDAALKTARERILWL